VSQNAKVAIRLINRRTGQVTRFEDFRLQSDLAARLVEQIEAMLADLAPGQTRVTRTMAPGGATLIDIDLQPFEKLSRRSGPGRVQPPNLTFEQRYRRKSQETGGEEAS
jgi:hypothetical protein